MEDVATVLVVAVELVIVDPDVVTDEVIPVDPVVSLTAVEIGPVITYRMCYLVSQA